MPVSSKTVRLLPSGAHGSFLLRTGLPTLRVRLGRRSDCDGVFY